MRSLRHTAAAATLLLLFAACGGDDDNGGSSGAGQSGSDTTAAFSGDLDARVQTFPVPSRNHVQTRVDYPQTPPVGGDHNPVWQNCGFYSEPVVTEAAVHSLEHGAVWITYRRSLPANQVDALRTLARNRAYVLVSPWVDESLPAPVVASAWGVQLRAETATDPAIAAFVARYAGGGQAPEPGASCSGAFGDPE